MKKSTYREAAGVGQIMARTLFVLLFFEMLSAETNELAPEEKRRQDSLRAVRLEKVAAFRAVYPQAKVQTDPATGAPKDIWGDISKNQTQTDPVEAAYEFFDQNKGIYGISNPRGELKLQRKLIDQYGGMVDFKQLYKGVEVYQSSLRAYYTPSGKLRGIKGGFAQMPLDFSVIPVIDSIAAIAIAKEALRLPPDYEKQAREYLGSVDSTTSPISVSLAITSFQEKYHLVWLIDLNVDYGHGLGSWKYFVDVKSGMILKREPLFMEEPD
ncbi:MAG: hypothetical protein L0Z48_07315, partial [candidate division Zixibacteria bacterium]|nr:hypothetical protein [candidate division Zixibacteria bacterium]